MSTQRSPSEMIRSKAANAVHFIHWLALKRKTESVFFYTFHKCASTLFGSFVLRQARGLRHVNYEKAVYSGKSTPDSLRIEQSGYVYGPIRLSSDPEGILYQRVVAPLASLDFIRDKRAIFFVRDPRDILVSAYYSFGYVHGLSPVEEIRERQLKSRNEIRQMSLDDYALKSAPKILDDFEGMAAMISSCVRPVVLRYEDMIEDFSRFSAGLTTYLDLSDLVLESIYVRTRPKNGEDLNSHRRSGKVGSYRSKLSPSAIETLNRIMEPALERFHYKD